MTCIIGYKRGSEVYMISDSAAGSDFAVAHSKLARSGKLLLGYTTSFRMGQLLEFSIRDFPEMDGMDEYEYLVTRAVPFIRKVLAEAGFTKIENNEEEGGQFLIAVNSRLFTIQDDFSVQEYLCDYAAVGSGHEYARGSMAVLVRTGGDPVDILVSAMRVVERHDGHVKFPFHVRSTKNMKPRIFYE